jgi:hypothetical protein
MLNGYEAADKILGFAISAPSGRLLQLLVDTGSFSIGCINVKQSTNAGLYLPWGIYRRLELLLLITSYCGWNLESETGCWQQGFQQVEG